jgi:crotonobetainyl-CoA:carnitine CoA-transferase CaiB-like acyl-CoA transferase
VYYRLAPSAPHAAAHGFAAMTSTAPFADLRVLDLSQGLAGPYCGMLLAHYGADVVKLEPPAGDWARALGTRYGSHSALDAVCNRGKQSLVLDLKNDRGRDAARRIAEQCDVIIESFRPGVVAKLGLGYEALRAANPGVVYVSVSGFGQSGPYAARPGTDMVAQSFSGMMSLNRDGSGKPNRIGLLVSDTVTALYAFQSVCVALYARRDTGRGAWLDISLIQSSAAFLAPKIIEGALEGDVPRQLNAPAGSYRTRDGWITITLSKEEHFAALCAAIGREALAADARFADFERRADNLAELAPLIQEPLIARNTAEWIEILERHDVLCNRVYAMSDWLDDPHVRAVGGYRTAQIAGMGPAPIAAIPGSDALLQGAAPDTWPEIGEHSHLVLARFGFGAEEIAAMLESGAVPALQGGRSRERS